MGGNAYDQFYGRSSHHNNYHSTSNYKPQHSFYQQQSQSSSSYYSGGHNNNARVSFLDKWNGHLSPILLVLIGTAYLCHRNGIPLTEFVSFLVWNLLFRRRRYGRGWGDLGGGGMHFRPTHRFRRY